MGELFANMDKMDIQAERRKTAEAQKALDKARKEAADAIDKVQKEMAQERENRIRDVVSVGKQFGATKEELAGRLRKTHGISQEEAMEKVELYWNWSEVAENEI